MLRPSGFLLIITIAGSAGTVCADNSGPFYEPMQFNLAGNGGNCSTCEWIDATGVIDAATPQRLQEYLDAEKSKWGVTDSIVMFNSPGGDLAGGLKLGEMLRRLGMTSVVAETFPNPDGHFQLTRAGVCASSCAYAFLGGVDRSLAKGSRLGFHQFSWGSKPNLSISPNAGAATGLSDAQIVMGVLAAYVVEMGVDARVLTIASKTSTNDIDFPSDDQLAQYHVLTASGFGRWQMKAVSMGLVAYTENQESSSLELSVSMFCKAPANTPYAMIKVVSTSGKKLTPQDFSDAIQAIALTVDDHKTILANTKDQLRRILSVSSDEAAYDLYVALSPDDAERLKDGKSFSLSLDSCHAFYDFGPHVAIEVNDTARKEIRLAFRNCI